MSLINQVLSDLEKRGVNAPLGEAAIRAVPVQNKTKVMGYIFAGVILLGAAAAGWFLRKPSVVAVSPVVAASAVQAVAPAVVTDATVAVVSQSQAASQAAEIEPADSADFSIASRLSFELGSIPLPNSLRGKPWDDLAIPAKEIEAPPVKANKSNANARSEPQSSVSIQLKKVSPQQQAENEFRKANLLAQQGLLKEAAAGYEAALHIDTLHVMAREALVAVLLESKQNADAEKVLQDGLKQNLKQTHFAMLLARLQVERNALPLALDTLEKSLPFADLQADYQAFMGALLQRQNRHKEAITHYQIALQITPNSGLWLMGLGISLQAVERKEDARDAYKRALETHSLSSGLQAFVAQRLKDLGK